MENYRNTQFISFTAPILSSVMKSHTIPLHSMQNPQPSTSSAPDIQPFTSSWLDDPGLSTANDPPCRYFTIAHHHKKGEYKPHSHNSYYSTVINALFYYLLLFISSCA